MHLDSSAIIIFLQNLRWLHRLQSALHVWFKREYKWWYPIELGRRLLLILMAVPFPSDKVSKYKKKLNLKAITLFKD